MVSYIFSMIELLQRLSSRSFPAGSGSNIFDERDYVNKIISKANF